MQMDTIRRDILIEQYLTLMDQTPLYANSVVIRIILAGRCRDSSVTLGKRQGIVQAKGLCQNCLNPGHMAHQCPRKAFSKCRNGDQNQHTLICVQPSSNGYNAPPNNFKIGSVRFLRFKIVS